MDFLRKNEQWQGGGGPRNASDNVGNAAMYPLTACQRAVGRATARYAITIPSFPRRCHGENLPLTTVGNGPLDRLRTRRYRSHAPILAAVPEADLGSQGVFVVVE